MVSVPSELPQRCALIVRGPPPRRVANELPTLSRIPGALKTRPAPVPPENFLWRGQIEGGLLGQGDETGRDT